MHLFTFGGYILESEKRKMSDNYCNNCKKKVPVWLRDRTVRLLVSDSRTVIYDEVYAVCQFCGREVYDSKAADMNIERRAFALSAN